MLFKESELFLLLRFCKIGDFVISISLEVTFFKELSKTSFFVGSSFFVISSFFTGDNEVKNVAGII
jgi:hypothetical protein